MTTFPSAAILDSFTRADQGPPAGPNWAGGGDRFETPGGPGLMVRSNQAVGSGTPGQVSASSYWTTTFGPNNEAYATLGAIVPPISSSRGYLELWARGSGFGTAALQGYQVEARPGSGDISLKKYPGSGNWYQGIGVAPVSLVLSPGDGLGIRVVGSRVEAWVRIGAGPWTLLMAGTDTSYPTGGQIGVVSYLSTRYIDDFGGGRVQPIQLDLDGTIRPALSALAFKYTRALRPSGLLAPAGWVYRKIPQRASGLLTPKGGFTRGTRWTAGVAPSGALGLQYIQRPIYIPPPHFRLMEEELYARLPFHESQEQLRQPGVVGRPVPASCGWHDSTLDAERGAFAIVSQDGPLADMVGERLAVSRRDLGVARTVYVYVHSDSNTITEELSLTRRAFMALGDPALDEVPVVVDVVVGAMR